MVEIGRLEAFGVAALENCPTLKSWEVVSTESELKDVMDKVREWPLLVIVIPSVQGDDNGYDNVADKNTSLFYVLGLMRESMGKEQRMNLWKNTQQGMKELKQYIHDSILGDFADIFGDMDFGARNQEPEYALLDCCGWSLVVNYSTDGV